jgi:hypothetical protein
MKQKEIWYRRGWRVALVSTWLFSFQARAADADSLVAIGETIRYSVHVSGIAVGTQTIKVVAEESFNGAAVFRVKGLTETTGISRILLQYSDEWTVLMDSSTLCPVWIEREIESRGTKSRYTYFIDQAEKKVTILDRSRGIEKIILASRVILDRYSLCFYYRKNPRLFQGGFSFAFLMADSVDTVVLREEGPVLIQIPKVSGRVATPVYKYVEDGGDGIEIYTGIDGFPVPLKIVFKTRLWDEKRAVCELYIREYAGDACAPLPDRYRSLSTEALSIPNI